MCGELCKQCTKLCGYGVVIWGVAFVVASVFVGFNVGNQIIMQGVTTLAVVATAFFLAKTLKLSNEKEALKYGACWVVVGLILDALVTARFTGWEFFYSWNVWVSYLLLLLTPFLAVMLREKGE